MPICTRIKGNAAKVDFRRHVFNQHEFLHIGEWSVRWKRFSAYKRWAVVGNFGAVWPRDVIGITPVQNGIDQRIPGRWVNSHGVEHCSQDFVIGVIEIDAVLRSHANLTRVEFKNVCALFLTHWGLGECFGIPEFLKDCFRRAFRHKYCPIGIERISCRVEQRQQAQKR